jgi:hypothetical protein
MVDPERHHAQADHSARMQARCVGLVWIASTGPRELGTRKPRPLAAASPSRVAARAAGGDIQQAHQRARKGARGDGSLRQWVAYYWPFVDPRGRFCKLRDPVLPPLFANSPAPHNILLHHGGLRHQENWGA